MLLLLLIELRVPGMFILVIYCLPAPPLKLIDLPGVDKGSLDDPLVRILRTSVRLNLRILC